MRSWGHQELWVGGEQINSIPITSGMSSLFFLENYGTAGKVSYDFFFLFQNRFFLKEKILYDSHAKARIVLG